MAMSMGTEAGAVMCDINTTPLIDVMLVMLIMLIITLPIMTHAVKLDMPQANQPPPPTDQRPEVIDLEIDFDGTVVWNGTVVPNINQLEASSAPKLTRNRSRRSICVPIAVRCMTWSPRFWPPRSATT